MTKKIYVVKAETGAYSDRVEWLVAAYDNQPDALLHVDLAAADQKRLRGLRNLHLYSYQQRDAMRNRFDPASTADADSYFDVEEVELLDKVPE